MSHEGYHRIETADMPRPDVNYLLTRLEGQLMRLELLKGDTSFLIQFNDTLASAFAFAKQLREALSERHIDVT